jgi:hypothetical protein
VIECQDCHRVFVRNIAYETHFSYDVKPGVHVTDPERAVRRRCGNDAELAGRGLTNHFWMLVN